MSEIGHLGANKLNSTLYALLIAVLFLFFLIRGASYFNRNNNTAKGDTTAYLKTSYYDIKQMGGALQFIPRCLQGEYKKANRHPFYMVLLSLFAERSVRFFVHAKLLSLCMGVLVVISFFWITCRLFNICVAVASLILFTMNRTFLDLTTMVACESTLLLFVLWSWYFMLRGIRKGGHFVFAGLICGLAYLTKGSGLFLVFAYTISGILIFRTKLIRRGYYWLFFVAFIITSFPLLARNIIVYRNPLYNYNSRVMWLDSWEEVYRPEYRERDGEGITMMSYFRTHSFQEAGMRFYKGMLKEIRTLYRMTLMDGTQPLHAFIFPALGFFFLIGCYKDDAKRVCFSLCIITVYFLIFSWYAQIMAPERFLLPILPFLLIYSTFGAWVTLTRIVKNHSKASRIWLVSVFGLTAVVAADTASGCDLSNPYNSFHFKRGYQPLMGWIAANALDSRFLLGPTHSYPLFYASQEIRKRDRVFPMPLVQRFHELEKYVRREHIKHIIVDSSALKRRKKLLKDFFHYQADEGLTIKRLPPRWHLVFQDPGDIPDYLVFQIVAVRDNQVQRQKFQESQT